MKKLLIFVGESGSGKTTTINELVKRYPDKFKRVITCTSRSARFDEVDGVDYHFCPAEYFVNNPDLLPVKKTASGDYYGRRKVDMHSDTHSLLLALRLDAVKELIDLGFENIIVVRISITEELKIERMRQRGDTEVMISNRLQSDVAERVNIDLGQTPIVNINATQTLDEKVELIIKACE